jgi:hypothetical protein
MAKKESTARRRLRRLPRQGQKPISQPTQQTRFRIQSHLDDAIGACEDLFREHGLTCECPTCRCVSNVVGALRVFHMVLQIS